MGDATSGFNPSATISPLRLSPRTSAAMPCQSLRLSGQYRFVEPCEVDRPADDRIKSPRCRCCGFGPLATVVKPSESISFMVNHKMATLRAGTFSIALTSAPRRGAAARLGQLLAARASLSYTLCILRRRELCDRSSCRSCRRDFEGESRESLFGLGRPHYAHNAPWHRVLPAGNPSRS